MTPLPYTTTASQASFSVTVAAFALLEQRTRFRSLRNRQGSRSDRGSLLIVIASVAVGVGGAFLLATGLPGAAIHPGRWSVFILGIVLMWAGIVIRQWAVTVLGTYFTVDVRIQSGQTVVDQGPYRWVRHPSYSGMILTLVGMGLALGNWASLGVIAIVPTAGLVVRIKLEEQTLLEALGEPYGRFASSRRRLFPGVW